MADQDEPKLDQPTDADLFQQAIEEPPTPVPAPVEPTPTPEPPKAPVSEPPPPVEAAIPSWRLREEAEGRRLAEDRARQLEARLNEVAAHMRQNQKQPDFFENPDAATQSLIARTLQPFVEQVQRERETDRKERIYLGKMVAESAHGADKVSAAEQAFLRARETQALDPTDYERVVQSPNRYDEVVRWHQRQTVLSSVGNDPNAWFEKQLEAKMADPTFQAKVLAKIQGDAASRPTETRLPPSLSRVTSSAGNRQDMGDMSDRSLFDFAMKNKR
jgi:hypothetical protein